MGDAKLRYMFGKSTNKEDFLLFLKTKIDEFVKYPRSTVLVLDNHRAHYSKVVTAWLAEKCYNVSYLPPYSSELNPIETIWALMKREWGKVLLSRDFETRMVKLHKPLKELREEFDEDSDGELMLTTRQKLSMKELKESLEKILDALDKRRLVKVSQGCCKHMMKLMLENQADESAALEPQ